DCRMFFNIKPPSSTFICGAQGSGKSHTLSCILENCLITSKAGNLSSPLTGLVFHYDAFISDRAGSPCEAAFLSSHDDVEMRVLCSPTNLHTIKIFNVCLTFFLEQAPETARVVGLDEAHKYMNASIEARKFTDTLLSAVRLQRHLGIRMIISTQEPTISATLLSLCFTTIFHRFMSPDWLKVLHRHLAGAAEEPHRSDPDDPSVQAHVSLLNQILDLQVGEALLFSPSAIIKASASEDGDLKFHRLGAEPLRIRVRHRITSDGGQTVLSL
ncbi:hypothetical protein ASPACDRAFT_26029, partial [Aspergillus aculeatus ATCC 16872]